MPIQLLQGRSRHAQFSRYRIEQELASGTMCEVLPQYTAADHCR
jgi:hypothetical protein